MATKKISELDNLGATPANNDVIPITDVSDTSESLSGTTKKVTVADFIASTVGIKTTLLPMDSLVPFTGSAAGLEITESSGGSVIIPKLLFDASTEERRLWIFRVPQAFTTATLKGLYYMASANTSKAVRWGARLAALSDTDASATAKTFATANESNVTCPDAAGTVDEFSLTLTNNDSMSVGDWVVIDIYREAADAGDTATGDAALIVAEISYA